MMSHSDSSLHRLHAAEKSEYAMFPLMQLPRAALQLNPAVCHCGDDGAPHVDLVCAYTHHNVSCSKVSQAVLGHFAYFGAMRPGVSTLLPGRVTTLVPPDGACNCVDALVAQLAARPQE